MLNGEAVGKIYSTGKQVYDLSLDELSVGNDVLNLFMPIFDKYGFDISRYKPGFMKRRIDRRMRLLEIDKYLDYASILQKEKSEFEELFVSLSINVTNFFRDIAVYDKIRLNIIPKIIQNLDNQNKIRIWSAGCATGEEAYSIAFLFGDETKKFANYNIEIIANDVSKSAVDLAKNGKYDAKSIEKLPNEMVLKYFEKITGDHEIREYKVLPLANNMMSFKTCDILSVDAKQFDMIFCRNVLIYYEKEAQELLINKFYHSLKNSGFLVLGMDESMLGRRCEKLFRPLFARERIYQKAPSNVNSIKSPSI